MKVIYVAHPYGGDLTNLASARLWLKWLLKKYPENAFIMPWIEFCYCYPEHDEKAQVRCLGYDKEVINRCDEVWLVGGKVSPGMQKEASWALVVNDLTNLGSLPPAEHI